MVNEAFPRAARPAIFAGSKLPAGKGGARPGDPPNRLNALN
jgi:hypothetical protein